MVLCLSWMMLTCGTKSGSKDGKFIWAFPSLTFFITSVITRGRHSLSPDLQRGKSLAVDEKQIFGKVLVRHVSIDVYSRYFPQNALLIRTATVKTRKTLRKGILMFSRASTDWALRTFWSDGTALYSFLDGAWGFFLLIVLLIILLLIIFGQYIRNVLPNYRATYVRSIKIFTIHDQRTFACVCC